MLQNPVMQCFIMEFLGKTSGAFTVPLSEGECRERDENGGNSPESTKAFTGWPLTLQLIYSITTCPKLSGASSIAIVMFSSMFCCLNLTEKREKSDLPSARPYKHPSDLQTDLVIPPAAAHLTNNMFEPQQRLLR